MAVIRVEVGKEIKNRGVFEYTVPEFEISGRSRQPLLDACREIKRMGGDTLHRQIGLYWPGKDQPSMACSVGWGAGHTVREDPSPHFVKWKAYPGVEGP